MASELLPIVEAIERVLREGGSCALATVVGTAGSTPGKTTMKMLVLPDGRAIGSVGGGCVEAEVLERALAAMKSERPERFAVSLNERDNPETGLVCGGRIEILVEPIVVPNVYLLGAGHVARALCRLGSELSFRFVVVDDREGFATQARFPGAAEVHTLPFSRVPERFAIGPGDFVVVVTRGHKQDLEALRALARSRVRPRYLGMIGSRAKRKTLLDALRSEEADPHVLEQVRTPIGLDIGAVTAEEIAVSVLAEWILLRRGRRGRPGPEAEPPSAGGP